MRIGSSGSSRKRFVLGLIFTIAPLLMVAAALPWTPIWNAEANLSR